MDPAAFGPSIAILVVLVFMLWFALGTQRNIRLGNGILEWLQDGLPLLGRRTTLRWLGSSAVQLDLIEPLQPFREVSVVVVLEPRDVAFLWAFARSRRRRDFLILRASIRRPPMFTIDVGSRDGWTGSVDRVDGGRPLDWPSEGAVGFASPDADEASGRDAWHKLAAASGGVWRLTIQPVVPHLEIHVRPPQLEKVSSERLVEALRDLALDLAADQRH